LVSLHIYITWKIYIAECVCRQSRKPKNSSVLAGEALSSSNNLVLLSKAHLLRQYLSTENYNANYDIKTRAFSWQSPCLNSTNYTVILCIQITNVIPLYVAI
jgi:hypothetical protein